MLAATARTSMLLLTLVTFCLTLIGCRTESTGEGDRTRDSEAVWADFGAPDGSFTVRMPGVPKRDESRVSERTMLNSMRSELGDTLLTVSWSDYDQKVLSRMEPQTLLGSLTFSSADIVNAKEISAFALTFGSHPGIELQATGTIGDDPASVHARMFLIDERLYQLIVTGPPGDGTAQVAERLFASFELKNQSPELSMTPLAPRRHPELGVDILWPAPPDSGDDLFPSMKVAGSSPLFAGVEVDGGRFQVMGVPLSPLQAIMPAPLARRMLLDLVDASVELRHSSTSEEKGIFRSSWELAGPEVNGLAQVIIRPGLAVTLVATWDASSNTPSIVPWVFHGASFAADHHRNPSLQVPWSPGQDPHAAVLFPGEPQVDPSAEDDPYQTATFTPAWPPVELSASFRSLQEGESAEDFITSIDDLAAAEGGQPFFREIETAPNSAVLDILVHSPDDSLVRIRGAAAEGRAVIMFARMKSPVHYGEVVERFMRSLRLGPGPLWNTQRFPSLRTAVRFPTAATIEVLPNRTRVSSSVKRITGVLEVRSDRDSARAGALPADGDQPQRHRGMHAKRATEFDQKPATASITLWSGSSRLELEAEADPELAEPHLEQMVESLDALEISPAWQPGPGEEPWIRVAPLGYSLAVEMPAKPTIERRTNSGGREIWQGTLTDESGLELSLQASWVPPEQTGEAVVSEVAAALEKNLGAPDKRSEVAKGRARGRVMQWDTDQSRSTVVALSDNDGWYLLKAVVPADTPGLDETVSHFLATFTID